KPAPALHCLDGILDVSAAIHLISAGEIDGHHLPVVWNALAVCPLLQVGRGEFEFEHFISAAKLPLNQSRGRMRTISRRSATSFSHNCNIITLPSLLPSVSPSRVNISLRRVASSGPLKTLYWIW